MDPDLIRKVAFWAVFLKTRWQPLFQTKSGKILFDFNRT